MIARFLSAVVHKTQRHSNHYGAIKGGIVRHEDRIAVLPAPSRLELWRTAGPRAIGNVDEFRSVSHSATVSRQFTLRTPVHSIVTPPRHLMTT